MNPMDRRRFMKTAMAAPIVSSLTAYGAEDAEDAATPNELSPMPCGDIKGMELSRLLLGGNLLTHYTHSRDLRYVYDLTAHYNTDEKIVETLRLSERHGINALVVHTVPHIIELLVNYRKEKGGKMQWIICPTTQIDHDRQGYEKQVRELVAEGCEAIYLWGVTADRLAAQDKATQIAEAVAIAHDHGVPSGVGAHDLAVLRMCEEHDIPADFYIKTFHHHNYPTGPRRDQLTDAVAEIPGYWCREPETTIQFMAEVKKPWIAFKVMAAGAIPPDDAFHYAFDHGADHILAGMFDFEIAEDVEITKDALALSARRERPWRS